MIGLALALVYTLILISFEMWKRLQSVYLSAIFRLSVVVIADIHLETFHDVSYECFDDESN